MEFVRFLRCLTGEGGVDLTETSDLEPVTYKPFGTMPSNDGISSVDIIGPNNGEAGGGVGADAADGNLDFDDFNDFEFFNNEEEGLDVGVGVGVDVGAVMEWFGIGDVVGFEFLVDIDCCNNCNFINASFDSI